MRDAAELHVFQRTPNWVLPKPRDPYTDEQKAAFRDQPELMAESRQQIFDAAEMALSFTTTDRSFFEAIEESFKAHLMIDSESLDEVVEDTKTIRGRTLG